MNFENKIRNQSTPYISQRVGTPINEIAKMYDIYQGRQDSVLNSRNELLDAFDSAGAMLDDEDRGMFNEYTKKTLEELKGLSENDYVGNMDRKLRSDAERFKTIHGQFSENTLRKQKFRESLINSGLDESVQQRYLQLAREKSGKFTYNPVTGQSLNKFVPLDILKEPDVHKYIGEFDNLVPTRDIKYYVNSKTGAKSLYEQDGFDQEANGKQKTVSPEMMKQVESRISQDYKQNYKRNIELGGKEYADSKYKELVSSVISGLSAGSYTDVGFKLSDIEKETKKEESKIRVADAKAKKDNSDMNAFAPVVPRNYRTHDFENIGDINSKMAELQEKGDKEGVNNLNAYRDRLEKKYGIKYGVDYDVFKYGITKGLHIINDDKKQLIEQANADLAKDAMPITQVNRPYIFDKPSDQATMTRQFQQALANLSDTNAIWGDDKMEALYHPSDAKTGEPLTKEQMTKLKNVEFNSIQLTPDGIYYTGRSNSSTKDQNSENSTTSDFNFKMKIPNSRDVLTGMINKGNIDAQKAYAYELTQGLDTNFGGNKRIKISGKPDVIVKKFLPSDNDGKTLKSKTGQEYSKTGYAVYLEKEGLVTTVPDYQSLLDVITSHIKVK